MDAIFDYNIKDEVIDGLLKVGLNPATIKYAILGHWHGDHAGGAKALQELGAQIIMGPADWDNIEKQNPSYKPKKDIANTDGMKVTLGDTTVTDLHHTGPYAGHRVVDLHREGPRSDARGGVLGRDDVQLYQRDGPRDGRVRGEARELLVQPVRGERSALQGNRGQGGRRRLYVEPHGVRRLQGGAPQLAARKPGDPNPLVVGKESVQRYMTVVGECAKAGALKAK
jgi:metallo-beta-lactamase class B